MAVLPLKVSHKQQRSVIQFRWTKEFSTNAIQSWDASSVWWQAFYETSNTFAVKWKYARGWEIVVDEDEPDRRVVLTNNAMITAVGSLIRSDRRVTG